MVGEVFGNDVTTERAVRASSETPGRWGGAKGGAEAGAESEGPDGAGLQIELVREAAASVERIARGDSAVRTLACGAGGA